MEKDGGRPGIPDRRSVCLYCKAEGRVLSNKKELQICPAQGMMRGKKEEKRGICFMIGIIGAMPVEVDKLIEAMEETSRETVSMVQFHQGVLAGVPVVVACCGAGKVCSAVCAQTMILKYAPRLIINLGVAGGIGPQVKIGDLVVATAVLQHDFDTSDLGEEKFLLPLLNKTSLEADERVSGLLVECAREVYPGGVHRGVVATGDQFIGSPERLRLISRETGALACEMEGGSIGHACALAGVPFAVVRAISDNADAHAVIDFPQFARESAQKSMTFLMKALPRL